MKGLLINEFLGLKRYFKILNVLVALALLVSYHLSKKIFLEEDL
ncbi:MAG: hypothetical protein RR841_03510 [Eubacterium sp.]